MPTCWGAGLTEVASSRGRDCSTLRLRPWTAGSVAAAKKVQTPFQGQAAGSPPAASRQGAEGFRQLACHCLPAAGSVWGGVKRGTRLTSTEATRSAFPAAISSSACAFTWPGSVPGLFLEEPQKWRF